MTKAAPEPLQSSISVKLIALWDSQSVVNLNICKQGDYHCDCYYHDVTIHTAAWCHAGLEVLRVWTRHAEVQLGLQHPLPHPAAFVTRSAAARRPRGPAGVDARLRCVIWGGNMRRHAETLRGQEHKANQKPFLTEKKEKKKCILYILLFQQLTGVTLYCFLLMQHFFFSFLFFSFKSRFHPAPADLSRQQNRAAAAAGWGTKLTLIT